MRVSNGLDPDQDRRSVGHDLCINCLQKLSADDKSHRVKCLHPTMIVVGERWYGFLES